MNNDYANTNENKLPQWLTEKNIINEVEFCNEFLQTYPFKCIGGKFYDIDGAISDSIISVRISQMLKYDNHIRNRNNERVRGVKGIKTSYVPIVI